MKNSIIGCMISATLLLSTVANAQVLYTEFTVGAAFPNNVSTETFEFMDGLDEYSVMVEGEFKGGIAAGVETGLRGIGSKHVDIGISYDYIQANLESVTAAGTLNGVDASETLLIDQLDAMGFQRKYRIHTMLGHVRYNFLAPSEPIQPFIGVAAGGASIEGTSGINPAFAGTAGFRVPLGYGFYLGARYRYLYVHGVVDDLGIDYDTFQGHTVSALFGAHL